MPNVFNTCDRAAAHAVGGVQHTDSLRPSAAISETFSRSRHIITSGAVLSTGRLSLVGVHLDAGQVVTNISFISGTQSAVTPLNQWFALYSAARAKLGVTADDTTTAWAANSSKPLALAAPYTVTASGLHYVGLCVVASIVPTIVSATTSVVSGALAPILTGTSDSGLTDPASAPATAAALSVLSPLPYAWVS